MGVNLSQCSGSHTELDQVREAKCSPADIVESITDTSSEDESANSSRPVQISPNHDENRPESCPMETPQSEEFRIRSDSMESETSPDILKSIDISDLSVSYAMNELLRYCESGNCGAVRLLLGRYNELLEMLNDYHDCHIGDREMNITPLMLAAACGHADLVDLLLLTPSVLINAKSNDGHGQTALHIAVSLGQLKCVQVLVNNSKVDVNALDSLEMTPLHGATSGHFDGAIELLLQRNDINCGLQDSNGNNILHIGAISTNVQAVKSIIQHASMTDYNEICRYEDQSVARNAIPMRRPMIGGSLKSLTDVSGVYRDYITSSLIYIL